MTRQLDYPQIPYHALLDRSAKRWPNRTAIVARDRRLSFAEIDRSANRLAHALIGLGVRPGDRVGLYLPNVPEFCIAFYGVERAGAVPTLLNPSYKERELLYQLQDSGAVALIAYAPLLPIALAVRSDLPELGHLIVVGGDGTADTHDFVALQQGCVETLPQIVAELDSVAALPYSSGTTGTSKGVMLTHHNLVSNVFQWLDATNRTEDDSILVFLPLYHIYGVAIMATSVASGAKQVLMERFDLAEVLHLLEAENITELYVVPPVMLALANAPGLTPAQFATLRFLMSAAAPLSGEMARQVADRLDVRVLQGYGMTESSPLTHMVPLDSTDRAAADVGVAVADTECRIVDLEFGEDDVPTGEVGEVVIAGPQIMAGYWEAPDETARALRDGWLYTGDVGRVDHNGRLTIVDRKKEMIKYKAFSIAPAELEALLLEHPAVTDCGVTAQPDAEAGEVPCAYVVLRAGHTATPLELQEFVKERVAGYKQIRSLDIVETIPRTPSGKILRRVLKEMARPQ